MSLSYKEGQISFYQKDLKVHNDYPEKIFLPSSTYKTIRKAPALTISRFCICVEYMISVPYCLVLHLLARKYFSCLETLFFVSVDFKSTFNFVSRERGVGIYEGPVDWKTLYKIHIESVTLEHIRRAKASLPMLTLVNLLLIGYHISLSLISM